MTIQSFYRETNATLLGIGLMLAAVVVFSLNNAIGKWVIGTIPVGEFLFMRGLLALILLGPFFWRAGWTSILNAPRKDLQIARVVLSAIEIAMFYMTVRYLPLADAMTFWLATPIYVTALSALVLGEKVGWRRWTAVIVGFVGVVLAMRPSAATFTGPALFGIAGSMLYAFVILATRVLRNTADVVLAGGSLGGSMILGLCMAPMTWTVPPLSSLGLTIIVAILFILGALFSNRSLKLAPASVVMPFQYTQIIWGTLFGYIAFGDVPESLTIVGAAIITGAGLYIFMREQKLARASSVPIAPP